MESAQRQKRKEGEYPRLVCKRKAQKGKSVARNTETLLINHRVSKAEGRAPVEKKGKAGILSKEKKRTGK